MLKSKHTIVLLILLGLVKVDVKNELFEDLKVAIQSQLETNKNSTNKADVCDYKEIYGIGHTYESETLSYELTGNPIYKYCCENNIYMGNNINDDNFKCSFCGVSTYISYEELKSKNFNFWNVTVKDSTNKISLKTYHLYCVMNNWYNTGNCLDCNFEHDCKIFLFELYKIIIMGLKDINSAAFHSLIFNDKDGAYKNIMLSLFNWMSYKLDSKAAYSTYKIVNQNNIPLLNGLSLCFNEYFNSFKIFTLEQSEILNFLVKNTDNIKYFNPLYLEYVINYKYLDKLSIGDLCKLALCFTYKYKNFYDLRILRYVLTKMSSIEVPAFVEKYIEALVQMNKIDLLFDALDIMFGRVNFNKNIILSLINNCFKNIVSYDTKNCTLNANEHNKNYNFRYYSTMFILFLQFADIDNELQNNKDLLINILHSSDNHMLKKYIYNNIAIDNINYWEICGENYYSEILELNKYISDGPSNYDIIYNKLTSYLKIEYDKYPVFALITLSMNYLLNITKIESFRRLLQNLVNIIDEHAYKCTDNVDEYLEDYLYFHIFELASLNINTFDKYMILLDISVKMFDVFSNIVLIVKNSVYSNVEACEVIKKTKDIRLVLSSAYPKNYYILCNNIYESTKGSGILNEISIFSKKNIICNAIWENFVYISDQYIFQYNILNYKYYLPHEFMFKANPFEYICGIVDFADRFILEEMPTAYISNIIAIIMNSEACKHIVSSWTPLLIKLNIGISIKNSPDGIFVLRLFLKNHPDPEVRKLLITENY